jgi:hypothetical protein
LNSIQRLQPIAQKQALAQFVVMKEVITIGAKTNRRGLTALILLCAVFALMSCTRDDYVLVSDNGLIAFYLDKTSVKNPKPQILKFKYKAVFSSEKGKAEFIQGIPSDIRSDIEEQGGLLVDVTYVIFGLEVDLANKRWGSNSLNMFNKKGASIAKASEHATVWGTDRDYPEIIHDLVREAEKFRE